MEFILFSSILVLHAETNRSRWARLDLIHTVTSMPVQEALAVEHDSEVLGHPLAPLDGSGVACTSCAAKWQRLHSTIDRNSSP